MGLLQCERMVPLRMNCSTLPPNMLVSTVLCFFFFPHVPNSLTQPINAFTWSWTPPSSTAISGHNASSFLRHFCHSHSTPHSLSEAIANIFSLISCLLDISSLVSLIHYPQSNLSTPQISTCHSPPQAFLLHPYY